MTDNVAILAGYTEEIVAYSAQYEFYLLVKPGDDLDGVFKAWDMDNQEWVHLNGWLYTIEEVPEDIYEVNQ